MQDSMILYIIIVKLKINQKLLISLVYKILINNKLIINNMSQGF